MNVQTHKTTNRLLELDALRGIAVLSVLLFHYTHRHGKLYEYPSPALFDFQLGEYGVNLFFIISGFVIFMTLEKTKRPMDFLVSRFSRLFPVYWTAIIVTFLAVHLFSLPGREVSVLAALFNMTMLQSWLMTPPVDGVYWTLTVELTFYVIMFIVYLCRQLPNIERWGLCWLGLMAVNHYILPLFDVHIPWFVEITRLFDYGQLFFAGILFYNLKTKGGSRSRYVALGLCLAMDFIIHDGPAAMFSVSLFFVLFYLFTINRLGWIAQKPLVFLGTISYSLYLVHQNIGYIVINKLHQSEADPLIRLLVPSIVVGVLAVCLTFWVERPALNWIRARYKGDHR